MGLIINNMNIRSSQFVNCWILGCVPAIVKYAKKSKRKSVSNILRTEHNDNFEGQNMYFKPLYTVQYKTVARQNLSGFGGQLVIS